MREFIYKTLVVIIALIIIFEFTIGKIINKFDQKADLLLSREGRKVLVAKIKNEIKKATDKENYLSNEERILINNFVEKIKKELNEANK